MSQPAATERPSITVLPQQINLRCRITSESDLDWLIGALTAAKQVSFPAGARSNVVLLGYPEGAKIPVIKALRSLCEWDLMTAKRASEALPAIVGKDLTGDQAKRYAKELRHVYATVDVVPA